MPNPFKIEVALCQHTPIIHFKHDQAGATLRATEVKPKLDRFILERLGGGDYAEGCVEAKKKGWLIGDGEQRALNYQLHIRAEGTPEKYVIASVPLHKSAHLFPGKKMLGNAPFFASNEPIRKGRPEDPEMRFGQMHTGKICAIFTVRFPELKAKIEECFPKLLVKENFGLRQSKGFGCFLPEDMKRNDFEDIIKELFRVTSYYKGFDTLEDAFKGLDREYKVLKAGLAQDPSQLNAYAVKRKGVEWEKEVVKEALVKGRGRNVKTDMRDDPKDKRGQRRVKYLRALLGVAELYEFPKENSTKVKIKGEKIERFRSPILFKIFKESGRGRFWVYLIPGKVSEFIYDQVFTFSNPATHDELLIKTPTKEAMQAGLAEGESWLGDFLSKHVAEAWKELN